MVTCYAEGFRLGITMIDLLLLAQDGALPDALPWWQQLVRNPIWLLVGMMLLFYVIVLVPDRRRRSQQAQRLKALKKNDRVVTIGGIHGTIVQAPADSNEITVRIDENNGTKIRVNRSAIADVITDESTSSSRESS